MNATEVLNDLKAFSTNRNQTTVISNPMNKTPHVPRPNPPVISTRRKFIIGLAVTTPLAIVAWDWWKPNRKPDPTPASRLQTQTLNNIITIDSYGKEVSRTSSTIQYFTETLNLPNGAVPIEMALIPKGKFTMGSPSNEKDRNNDESPQHEVNFPQDFYMGRYAVTQVQWLAVMGSFSSEFNSLDAKFKGNNLPMVRVS